MTSLSKRVVPDIILENLTCRICCKYLTVSPIGVHPDGGNICGRCLYGKKSSPTCLFECMEDLNYHSFQGFIPMVLLGYASYPETLFPCVNRFEGCNKLLPFSAIKNHEKICVYKKFQCPLCQFQGVGSQLIQHFRTGHKRYLSSENPVFILKIDNDFSETYLFRSENTLFLVKVEYIKDLSQFMFETLCLGTPSRKLGRLRILFRIPSGSISTYNDYILLSDRLEISRNCRFNMTFKINDFRLSETKNVVCSYNLFYTE
ncbi:E3 ubiquitin-protein ligase siah2-like [Anoplophora glabripennis]|uniref:E3 ubiquitin-protein ligase siah2-like n=1 Tax=Anoplophora glabripennis TaxID=217634 RepID=UPI0008740419|nr:E3 ubiquitin-protein ligase siah2-like [Anoplophora glabripennis]XP_018567304.1 E3 ubiquitin-protein ligase siah2-like [Anoplophora glabripennis]XP_018567305.1 E3 ubiquitin-protein ligase siah2-like [Anoplophora glabripennis]XP_018567306.1 E3 ubiquitin-protein ligase siah2-like [Anoplophora glabripennis]